MELGRLKTVLLQSCLAAAERRENEAEHSWHLAMMVAVLCEHCDEPVYVGHTTELALLHDLVEIYAGGTALRQRRRCRSAGAGGGDSGGDLRTASEGPAQRLHDLW
ncbi:HD domain-containing protein [Streptomyces tendae]|uniref:HD domain-containing protein n=1 Tax=Streptomyces tendae TaxID=1932 RepID=UPI00369E1048